MAKMLSIEPLVDPTASLRETNLGAYCEVGARTMLLDVEMGDYSYVVNDAQMTYTMIGKFCSIAAMTRINPGDHPMHRATQAHFSYRASAYFPGEADDAEFFEWRKSHRVHIGHDVWIGHGAVILPGRNVGTGAVVAARYRHQGRAGLYHRRRQSRAADQATLLRRDRGAAGPPGLVGLGSRKPSPRPARLSQAHNRGIPG